MSDATDYRTILTMSTEDYEVRFIRNEDGTIASTNSVTLIRMIREMTDCSLLDAKNFCDRFRRDLSSLAPSNQRLLHQIASLANNVTDTETLRQVRDLLYTAAQ